MISKRSILNNEQMQGAFKVGWNAWHVTIGKLFFHSFNDEIEIFSVGQHFCTYSRVPNKYVYTLIIFEKIIYY